MEQFLSLMGKALVVGLIMSPIHCLFGLHIVRRGVIFIDLAVAQMAALGVSIAIARGADPQSAAAYWTSLTCALGSAFAISLTKFKLGRVPHEAIIGIIFVVASASSIIVLQNTPHGPEELRDILAGSILLTDDAQIRTVEWLYGSIFLALLVLWRWISRNTDDQSAKITPASLLIDFLFYGLLGVVVSSSVKIAGVLVVFAWLVMPAVCAFFFVKKMAHAVALSLPIALAATSIGVYTSYAIDWPTGAAIVLALGAFVALSYLVRLAIPMKTDELPAHDGKA